MHQSTLIMSNSSRLQHLIHLTPGHHTTTPPHQHGDASASSSSEIKYHSQFTAKKTSFWGWHFIDLFNHLLIQQRILQIFVDISCRSQGWRTVSAAPNFFIILLQQSSKYDLTIGYYMGNLVIHVHVHFMSVAWVSGVVRTSCWAEWSFN